jgi:Subtilase family
MPQLFPYTISKWSLINLKSKPLTVGTFAVFVIVSFLLPQVVNAVALDDLHKVDLVSSNNETIFSISSFSSASGLSSTSVSSLPSSEISSTQTNLTSYNNFSSSSTSSSTLSGTNSVSSSQSTTSSSQSKAKINIDSLPKKIKLLKNKKLLNVQGGVNTSDNWWTGQGSGNNLVNSNLEINTFLNDPANGFTSTSLQKVKLAIIDSGIDTALPGNSKINFDILNSIRYYTTAEDPACDATIAYLPVPEIEVDIDGNPTGNFVDSATNFYCRSIGSQFDDVGHGTAVAYVAGQALGSDNSTLDNSIQVLPIAMHGYALDSFMLADAIKYAADNGANVINMSIGSPYRDSILRSAIRYAQQKGVLIVASSGNCGEYTVYNCDTDGDGIQTPGLIEEENNAPNYPASYSGVISVGASNYKLGCEIDLVNNACPLVIKSSYSNSASNLALIAPVGNGIVVPDLGEEAGTSFAAPQVAGALVKMMAIKNSLNQKLNTLSNEANQLTTTPLAYLKSGATDLLNEDYTPGIYVNQGIDYDTGSGLLNLLGSWKLLKQDFVAKVTEIITANTNNEIKTQGTTNTVQSGGGVIVINTASSVSTTSSNPNQDQSEIKNQSSNRDQFKDNQDRILYRLQGIGGAVDRDTDQKLNTPKPNTNDIVKFYQMYGDESEIFSVGKGASTVRTGGDPNAIVNFNTNPSYFPSD